jgi:hypothetical protein
MSVKVEDYRPGKGKIISLYDCQSAHLGSNLKGAKSGSSARGSFTSCRNSLHVSTPHFLKGKIAFRGDLALVMQEEFSVLGLP